MNTIIAATLLIMLLTMVGAFMYEHGKQQGFNEGWSTAYTYKVTPLGGGYVSAVLSDYKARSAGNSHGVWRSGNKVYTFHNDCRICHALLNDTDK